MLFLPSVCQVYEPLHTMVKKLIYCNVSYPIANSGCQCNQNFKSINFHVCLWLWIFKFLLKLNEWQNQIWVASFDPNWTWAIEYDAFFLLSSVKVMLMIPRKLRMLFKNTISFKLWIMQGTFFNFTPTTLCSSLLWQFISTFFINENEFHRTY